MPQDGRALHDRRILVVEDEFLIASELACLLNDAGAVITGPCASVREAFAAIDDLDGGIDAAILDVNLGEGGKSYSIADRLESLGIPYVFTTGYARSSDNPSYSDRPRLEKPVRARALLSMMQSLCDKPPIGTLP